MFGKRKRPWKGHAYIERITRNDGDVKFRSNYRFPKVNVADGHAACCEFESLSAVEAHLDAWWAEYWPRQVKSTRRA